MKNSIRIEQRATTISAGATGHNRSESTVTVTAGGVTTTTTTVTVDGVSRTTRSTAEE